MGSLHVRLVRGVGDRELKGLRLFVKIKRVASC